MNPILAAPLGVAAALAGALADAPAVAAEEIAPHPQIPTAAELPRDLLAPRPEEAAAQQKADDPAKSCDDKCKIVALTEATLPGTGASQLAGVLLQPEEHGLNISDGDGAPALTIKVMPTKITHGQGLVATAKF
jgi:hypothetical protein